MNTKLKVALTLITLILSTSSYANKSTFDDFVDIDLFSKQLIKTSLQKLHTQECNLSEVSTRRDIDVKRNYDDEWGRSNYVNYYYNYRVYSKDRKKHQDASIRYVIHKDTSSFEDTFYLTTIMHRHSNINFWDENNKCRWSKINIDEDSIKKFLGSTDISKIQELSSFILSNKDNSSNTTDVVKTSSKNEKTSGGSIGFLALTALSLIVRLRKGK